MDAAAEKMTETELLDAWSSLQVNLAADIDHSVGQLMQVAPVPLQDDMVGIKEAIGRVLKSWSPGIDDVDAVVDDALIGAALESSAPVKSVASPFEWVFKDLLGIEGDYSNHPADAGLATRWGITERVARRHGYEGDMRELPVDLAKDIYRQSYWRPVQCDTVHQYSPILAERLFDVAVNAGPGRAAEFLQRCLNVMNREGKDYADVEVDRDIGPATLNALKAFHGKRGAEGMLALTAAYTGLQTAFYVELSERRSANQAFTFGWIRARIVEPIKKFAKQELLA